LAHQPIKHLYHSTRAQSWGITLNLHETLFVLVCVRGIYLVWVVEEALSEEMSKFMVFSTMEGYMFVIDDMIPFLILIFERNRAKKGFRNI
jgi:hypothetical protein